MGPTGQQILKILSASPKLLTLALSDLVTLTDNGQTVPPHVKLPKLTRLSVSRLSWELFSFVLGAIRVPRCQNLLIDVDPPPQDTLGLLADPATAHIASGIMHMIASSSTTTVECNGESINITSSSKHHRHVLSLTLHLNGVWELAPPEGLRSVLDQAGEAMVIFQISHECSIPGIIPLLRSTCRIGHRRLARLHDGGTIHNCLHELLHGTGGC